MSRTYALLMIVPMLASTPALAQDSSSPEPAASTAGTAQCVSKRPTIFSGRAPGQDCVVPSWQPRCKATRPSIFSGRASSGGCVVEPPRALTVSYRPTIFGGSGRKPASYAGYAGQPAYAGYAQPGGQPAYSGYAQTPGQPATAQGAYGYPQPQAEQPRVKRRRPTIFGGGRRSSD